MKPLLVACAFVLGCTSSGEDEIASPMPESVDAGAVEGEDDGQPTNPSDPDPLEPEPDPECVDSALVLCAYDTSAEEWNAPHRTVDTLEIPIGKVVVSTFHTGDGSIESAKFSYRTPVGDHTEGVNLWISKEVMGTTVSSRCDLDNAQYAFQMRVTLSASFFCEVDPNTTYFLHIEHVNPQGQPLTLIRELTTN